jgi:hypothetical protein
MAPTRGDGCACNSSGSLGELDGLAHGGSQIRFDVLVNHGFSGVSGNHSKLAMATAMLALGVLKTC